MSVSERQDWYTGEREGSPGAGAQTADAASEGAGARAEDEQEQTGERKGSAPQRGGKGPQKGWCVYILSCFLKAIISQMQQYR